MERRILRGREKIRGRPRAAREKLPHATLHPSEVYSREKEAALQLLTNCTALYNSVKSAVRAVSAGVPRGVQCTLYSVHCTVQYTVCTVQSWSRAASRQ